MHTLVGESLCACILMSVQSRLQMSLGVHNLSSQHAHNERRGSVYIVSYGMAHSLLTVSVHPTDLTSAVVCNVRYIVMTVCVLTDMSEYRTLLCIITTRPCVVIQTLHSNFAY